MPTDAPTAKPVISKIQSVIGYLQWQAFEFQPTATNSPTRWTSTPLAPGLVFDDETGAIMGAATMPGVYVFTLQAENALGLSDPETFVMGIEASGFVQPANVLEIVIELNTRKVSLGGETSTASATSNKLEPLFWTKAGDHLLMNVRFVKGGVVADLEVTGLKFALKELEPENVLISSIAWARVGSGENASFRVFTHIESSELRSALSNYEDDLATQFLALGEFEWTENNMLEPKVGPDEFRSSSRTFGVMLPRDLIPNP